MGGGRTLDKNAGRRLGGKFSGALRKGESTGVLNDETKVMERGVTRAAKLSHNGMELRLERSRGVGTGGGRKCGSRDPMSGERCEREDSETKASTTVARSSTKAEQSGRHA
jgi:hypothetical protein